MLTILKKIRRKLLQQNKLIEYFKYAIGEIILVVIGILIALSINNWNESRKQENTLHDIYAILVEDIKNDTAEVRVLLQEYSELQDKYDRVVNYPIKPETFVECELCADLGSVYMPFTMEKRGYELLKNYNGKVTDTLTNRVVQSYRKSIHDIEASEHFLKESIYEYLKKMRDNYKWFAPPEDGNLSPDFVEYACTNFEYKNNMIWQAVVIYQNVVPNLEQFMKNQSKNLELLEAKLEK